VSRLLQQPTENNKKLAAGESMVYYGQLLERLFFYPSLRIETSDNTGTNNVPVQRFWALLLPALSLEAIWQPFLDSFTTITLGLFPAVHVPISPFIMSSSVTIWQ